MSYQLAYVLYVADLGGTVSESVQVKQIKNWLCLKCELPSKIGDLANNNALGKRFSSLKDEITRRIKLFP